MHLEHDRFRGSVWHVDGGGFGSAGQCGLLPANQHSCAGRSLRQRPLTGAGIEPHGRGAPGGQCRDGGLRLGSARPHSRILLRCQLCVCVQRDQRRRHAAGLFRSGMRWLGRASGSGRRQRFLLRIPQQFQCTHRNDRKRLSGNFPAICLGTGFRWRRHPSRWPGVSPRISHRCAHGNDFGQSRPLHASPLWFARRRARRRRPTRCPRN